MRKSKRSPKSEGDLSTDSTRGRTESGRKTGKNAEEEIRDEGWGRERRTCSRRKQGEQQRKWRRRPKVTWIINPCWISQGAVSPEIQELGPPAERRLTPLTSLGTYCVRFVFVCTSDWPLSEHAREKSWKDRKGRSNQICKEWTEQNGNGHVTRYYSKLHVIPVKRRQ